MFRVSRCAEKRKEKKRESGDDSPSFSTKKRREGKGEKGKEKNREELSLSKTHNLLL